MRRLSRFLVPIFAIAAFLVFPVAVLAQAAGADVPPAAFSLAALLPIAAGAFGLLASIVRFLPSGWHMKANAILGFGIFLVSDLTDFIVAHPNYTIVGVALAAMGAWKAYNDKGKPTVHD